jgi:hypothetical protein
VPLAPIHSGFIAVRLNDGDSDMRDGRFVEQDQTSRQRVLYYRYYRWRRELFAIGFTVGITVTVVGLIYAYLSASRSVQSLLTVFVGAILAFVSNYVLQAQRSSEEREREMAAEVAQRERELTIANQLAQDNALETYLDQMGQLLLHNDSPLLQLTERDEVRILARVRTLTVLKRLGPERKQSVLQFLYESNLITKDHVVVDLSGADLREANLGETHLSHAHLRRADLYGADLYGANLSGADLSSANVKEANLEHAELSGADLAGANLIHAKVTDEQLAEAKSLQGATMPDGSIHD